MKETAELTSLPGYLTLFCNNLIYLNETQSDLMPLTAALPGNVIQNLKI